MGILIFAVIFILAMSRKASLGFLIFLGLLIYIASMG